MILKLETVMRAVVSHPDAAIESGWCPRVWEDAGGFENLVRSRLHRVIDLQLLLAYLGAPEVLQELGAVDSSENLFIQSTCSYDA